MKEVFRAAFFNTTTKGADMGVGTGGLLGLVVLLVDIWAIISIMQSPSGTGSRVIWIVIILFLPLLGLLLWFLLGPKTGHGGRKV